MPVLGDAALIVTGPVEGADGGWEPPGEQAAADRGMHTPLAAGAARVLEGSAWCGGWLWGDGEVSGNQCGSE